jgi:hypothetical protein
VTADPDEAERTRQAFELESWARKQPPGPADPARVLRVRFDGNPPGWNTYWLARWSLVNRFVRDAKKAGVDQVTDLGPLPLTVDQPRALIQIGVKRHSTWVTVTPGMEAIAAAVADLERGRN